MPTYDPAYIPPKRFIVLGPPAMPPKPTFKVILTLPLVVYSGREVSKIKPGTVQTKLTGFKKTSLAMNLPVVWPPVLVKNRKAFAKSFGKYVERYLLAQMDGRPYIQKKTKPFKEGK